MDLKFLLDKAIKLHVHGKLDKAEIIYDKIIKFDANNLIANANLGSLNNSKKKYSKALRFLDHVLKMKPDFIDALNNKGNSLKGLNQYQEALTLYNKALEINHNFVDALNNKANCLRYLEKFEEALIFYEKVLKIKPNFVEAVYNKGICFYLLNQLNDAINCYQKTIELNPNFIEGYYNLGLLQLTQGNYKDGWKNYEWRQNRSNQKKEYPYINRFTNWTGKEDINNKTIFISKEQGLGDYIHYCRYLPMVQKLGAEIFLDTPKPLIPLINTMKIDYNHIDNLKDLKFDYHCPIVSLPYLFNTSQNNIPNQIPYLFTPRVKKEYWKKKLEKNEKKMIGIKWCGIATHKNDKNRSANLEKIKSLFDLPYEFHSLDFELKEEDKRILKEIPNLKFHGKDLLGLDSTAGLIEQLDLIISVDTSMAHLSASIGKKVWIILPHIPDYRWLLNCEDSPWYPNVKLYRQSKKDDWVKIINIIKKDIAKT